MRADRYLSDIAAIMNRSQLKARGARLFCNGREVKLSHKIKQGDHLRLEWTDAPSEVMQPEELSLSILYEDKDVFVFNKAQGMVTHPAAGNWSGTLANGVLWLLQKAALSAGASAAASEDTSAEPPPRCGIVHRLDKDTSGVIITARTLAAHEYLARQFHDREAKKEYVAILKGLPPAWEGTVETWLARSPHDRKKFAVSPQGRGKHALTLYRVRSIWEIGAKGSVQRYALVLLYPRTGRTHQLRVHMAHLGCPILGDPLYAKKDALFPGATLMLHARRLKIGLPSDGQYRIFAAPLPERFREVVTFLEEKGKRVRTGG